MTFYDKVQEYDWEEVRRAIYAKTAADVERALGCIGTPSLDDFMALVSPAAESYLERMARKSYAITRRRFGNVMQLYTPLYLSNFCLNRCVYCGFSALNKIKRAALTPQEIDDECRAIRRHPFENILLVTGESPHKYGVEYLGDAIVQVKKYFENISIEVQPLDTDEYKELVDKGLYSVSVYQETYNEKRYPEYHLGGKKRDYRYRLETADRLGEAGIYKVGLGALLGLEDWRTECFFIALQLRYLETKYWKTKCSVSFPRLRPCAGDGFQPNHIVTERHLVQMITAYRIFSEDVELNISTRESPYFRDNVLPLGVTSISAGSKTTPGGYSDYEKAKELEQFSVNDDRSVDEIVAMIKSKGFEPVWKDWSLYLQSSEIA